MNGTPWRGLKLASILAVAAVFTAAAGGALRILGVQPDLMLTTSLVGSLFFGETGASFTGFFGALLFAALSAPPRAGVGSLLVSRTVSCFVVGWMENRVYRDHVLIAILTVLLGTLISEMLFYLFYPQRDFLHWGRAALQTTLYNAVLSVPIYFAIRFVIRLGVTKKADQLPYMRPASRS